MFHHREMRADRAGNTRSTLAGGSSSAGSPKCLAGQNCPSSRWLYTTHTHTNTHTHTHTDTHTHTHCLTPSSPSLLFLSSASPLPHSHSSVFLSLGAPP